MLPRLGLSAESWQNLSATQRMGLALAVVALLVGVGVAVSLASAPKYAQLYGSLTAADASVVVEKLKEMKVPYRLTGHGSGIDIPQDRVDDVRLSLAGEGIPQGGNVGFELFDKTQLGMSVFGEKMTYLRAIQGELARTISQLKSVQSARVHLVIPDQRLYAEEQKKATASVVLTLKTGTPAASEIKSIIHLVSSAVEGLEPANVTVVDTTGTLLSEMVGDEDGGNTSLRQQAQRTAAQQIEQRVQSMLDSVLGAGKAIVRANVKLNFDHKQLDRETYTPLTSGDRGILESEQHSKETYSGTKPGMAGGPVGAVANTAQLNSTVSSTATNATVPNGYLREESTSQYRVSKQIEHIEVSPGQVERLNLALFIDKSVDEKQIASLQKTVAAAVGIDEQRGDQIMVQSIAFDTVAKTTEEKEAKQAARMSLIVTAAKYGLGVLIILVFLLILRSIYRNTLAPVTAQLATAGAGGIGTMSLDMTPSGAEFLDALPGGSIPPSLASVAENAIDQYRANAGVDTEAEMELPEEEIAVANMDAQRIAQVIRSLLADD